ncbi:hypothetical protein [Clostridium felsineum]|nr:hypothetical protein [Clostridium felsineum]URZ14073.1 hypothetical protein CLFE_000480 [Clostridium felsineum DSM 794]
MDINELITEIKKDGYHKPQIGLITPEIRTIDEHAMTSVTFIDDEETEE